MFALPISTASGLKLNLGCSDAHLAGYVNVNRCQPADLVYDVRNEQLLISGGNYEILPEGINK
jgi:hypothetical protein